MGCRDEIGGGGGGIKKEQWNSISVPKKGALQAPPTTSKRNTTYPQIRLWPDYVDELETPQKGGKDSSRNVFPSLQNEVSLLKELLLQNIFLSQSQALKKIS